MNLPVEFVDLNIKNMGKGKTVDKDSFSEWGFS
jgi:hypothetical protein